MKLIIDEREFDMYHIDTDSFIVHEKKTPKPEDDLRSVLTYKDGWNDPDSDTIARTYKSIKMNGKYYALICSKKN